MLSDEEIDRVILDFLVKKGRWGSHYFPLDTLVRWLGKRIGRDGKRVRKRVRYLAPRSGTPG